MGNRRRGKISDDGEENGTTINVHRWSYYIQSTLTEKAGSAPKNDKTHCPCMVCGRSCWCEITDSRAELLVRNNGLAGGTRRRVHKTYCGKATKGVLK